MKKFILKYKWHICYWVIFLFLLCIWSPRQSDYYLNADIDAFKSNHFLSILIGIWVVLALLLFILLIKSVKSFIKVLSRFVYASFMAAVGLMFFKSIILAAVLFVNRLYTRGSIKRSYTITTMVGDELNKKNLILYEGSTKQINYEEKLREKLYRPGFKDLDTTSLIFNKGLFGIAFQPHPLTKFHFLP